jgi:peptide/nickel transport system substrate-binding protein
MKAINRRSNLFAGLLIIALFLSACSSATQPATTPTAVVPTALIDSTKPIAPTATTAPAAPTDTAASTQDPRIGGTAGFSVATDPDTLDIQKSSSGVTAAIMDLVGGSLLSKDPQTGALIPYLAKSWTVSEDGKTITFTLKDGVKFHDGTPLTADDYAWTLNRAIDPQTASPVSGTMLQGMTDAKALDPQTLQLTLSQPNYYILDGLALGGYLAPYSKAYAEKNGDDYLARNPMSVGPYIFKEWRTGESITLERNPDFTWGPDYAPGPRFVQTLVFKIIPDQATDVAALEAGETVTTGVPQSEISRFEDPAKFTIYHTMGQTLYPALVFNLNKDPWKDIKIRQALSYAIDRQSIVDVFLQGQGEISYGPLPPSIPGYTKDVESFYHFDSAKALSTFAEAGYTPDAKGALSKDGVPLTIKLLTPSYDFILPGLALVKDQLKTIGIEVTIESLDPTLVDTTATQGDYDLLVTGYNYNTADILYFFFHSSMIGAGTNYTVSDPTLDKMLDESRTNMDPTQHDKIVHDIQMYIMDNAYWVTLVNSIGNQVVSTNVQDAYWSDALSRLVMENAWLKNK